MSSLNALNLGCGSRYHKEWVNIDFVSSGDDVIAHNLLEGIPYQDKSFTVVYHSHLLEHIPKSKAEDFIKECWRVLEPGGILRIAIPDLEAIARDYLDYLNKAVAGDKEAAANYDWIMLELYDQVVREQSGGEMLSYLCQAEIPNEDFVYSRIGEEGRSIRKRFLNMSHNGILTSKPPTLLKRAKKYIRINTYVNKLRQVLVGKQQDFISLGQFRLGGEVHQWMYDRFSISRLLAQHQFTGIELKDAFTSQIPDWNSFELDGSDGRAFKPDSLYIEALKP